MNRSVIFLTSFIFSGCLFQHDTRNEVNYIGNYYLYEHHKVDLNIGSLRDGAVNVIAQKVDSIGHSDFYILGFAKGKYFLIDRYSHQLYWHESREHISVTHKDVPDIIPIHHVSEIFHPKDTTARQLRPVE